MLSFGILPTNALTLSSIGPTGCGILLFSSGITDPLRR